MISIWLPISADRQVDELLRLLRAPKIDQIKASGAKMLIVPCHSGHGQFNNIKKEYGMGRIWRLNICGNWWPIVWFFSFRSAAKALSFFRDYARKKGPLRGYLPLWKPLPPG